ncbi:POZ domain-containing protein [Hesseltinella vesiculosa]|uniref:POZ domain-containing protein n=1 Tax=Hesseltinella vesiculosa TaxID=101127 RepID=A0A1X2GAU0_9FUNG|nr:POZ domain-containing protein [Hesseltinella vesiculosa]
MTKGSTVSKSRVMELAQQEMTTVGTLVAADDYELTMDPNADNVFDELCTACKQGDLEKVESLVSSFGASVNQVDDWQASPLYWSCLCGHYEIVKFLLENGAQCDPNTFQGERCAYGALNSDIRTLLFSYKITKATDTNQPYLAFLTDLLYDHPFDDVCFSIRMAPPTNSSTADTPPAQYHSFAAHRCMLVARSPYFKQHLLERWKGQTNIKLNKSLVDPTAFGAVLRYIYTGQLGDADDQVLENIVFVCRHLDMPELSVRCQQFLETPKNERKRQLGYDAKEMARIRLDMEQFLQHLLFTAAHVERQGEADWMVRQRFLEYVHTDDSSQPLPLASMMDPTTTFADVAVYLTQENILFPCHKSFLCRSDYFKYMLQGTFAEASAQTSSIHYENTTTIQLPVVQTDVPSDVFQFVLEFLYTDRCTIPIDAAYDVLLVADLLLMDRLKALAAIALTSHDQPILPIFDLMQTALDLNVDRLEQWCTQYFAKHFDDYIHQDAFQNLIRQSAQTIAGRQETDSIPFVDELRYYLGKLYSVEYDDLGGVGNMFGDTKEGWTELEREYNAKLDILDAVLENLGLEA